MRKAKQHKKKNNKQKQSRNTVDGISATSNALTKLPRSVTNIVPDRMYTRLRFLGYGSLVIPTVSTVASSRYRPTGVFDVDPILASTATPGFAELAALYSSYRTTSSRFKVCATNTSATQGVIVVILPLNADPTGSPAVQVVNSWIEQPYAKVRACGTSGSPAVTLTSDMSTEKIFGSKMVYLDDNFQSLVTTIPLNNWFWAVGVIAPAAPTSAQSINVLLDVEMGVEFFNRKALLQ